MPAANEAQNLAEQLERFGAKASTHLLPEDERLKRLTSTDRVRIPLVLADTIAAILFACRGEQTGRENNGHPTSGARHGGPDRRQENELLGVRDFRRLANPSPARGAGCRK